WVLVAAGGLAGVAEGGERLRVVPPRGGEGAALADRDDRAPGGARALRGGAAGGPGLAGVAARGGGGAGRVRGGGVHVGLPGGRVPGARLPATGPAHVRVLHGALRRGRARRRALVCVAPGGVGGAGGRGLGHCDCAAAPR